MVEEIIPLQVSWFLIGFIALQRVQTQGETLSRLMSGTMSLPEGAVALWRFNLFRFTHARIRICGFGNLNYQRYSASGPLTGLCSTQGAAMRTIEVNQILRPETDPCPF